MLYDEILAQPPTIFCECDRDAILRIFMETLSHAVRVKADNVAEYLFLGTEQEEWDLLKDFPKVVSPFPVMWIEWARPAKSNSGGKIVPLHDRGMRCGALLMTQELTHASYTEKTIAEKIRAVHATASILDPCLRERIRTLVSNNTPLVYNEQETQMLVAIYDKMVANKNVLNFYRWGMSAFLVLSVPDLNNRHPFLVPHEIRFVLSPEGQIIGVPNGTEEKAPFVCLPFNASITEAVSSQFFFVPFLTLSFLHCKNIQCVEVRPPEKLNKARVRRGKQPLVSHYTLEITPMREILRVEGQSQSLGLQRALHLCRGHFADYTHGKGLFGKYHGQFWIPQHQRGSAKQGIVNKDYAVNAPQHVDS